MKVHKIFSTLESLNCEEDDRNLNGVIRKAVLMQVAKESQCKAPVKEVLG